MFVVSEPEGVSDNAADSDESANADAVRTCVGCRDRASREALLRLCHLPEHEVPFIPDLTEKLGGRGVWVHFRRSCIERAVRGGLARAVRQQVRIDPVVLLSLAKHQVDRRIQGLLLSAMRRRQVAVGTDAVIAALSPTRGSTAACATRLLLVASDAAGRRTDVISHAADRGVPVIELLDKDSLGHLTGREALSFIAVLDRQIARRIAESARWLAGLSEDG